MVYTHSECSFSELDRPSLLRTVNDMSGPGKLLRKTIISVILACLAAASFFFYLQVKGTGTVPPGFISGNGRLEATEVDIATKLAGRLSKVLVREGDLVEKGQTVARMDISILNAQLKQAEAEVKRMKQARKTALSRVESIRLKAELAGKELGRSQNLFARGIATQQQLDRDLTAKQSLEADYSAVRSSVSEAEDAIESAEAQVERLKDEINDCILRSPIKGPVLTRLAEPGEVLPNGGKVLTIIDPTDIYMNIYLSEDSAGKIPLAGEAKVILDAIPDRRFPAKVAYVSGKAQFTPKEVESADERKRLIFRVTLSLQECNDARLKPGMPGISYVRTDQSAPWPDSLK